MGPPRFARLIANAAVHYNSILLSEVLKIVEVQPDGLVVLALQRVSPLAWQRINFYGRYRFDNDLRPLDLAAIATQLTAGNANLWQRSAQ